MCVRGGGTHADPGVFEGLLSRDALGRVNGQHLVDQVLGLGSHRVPLWGRKLRRETGSARALSQRRFPAELARPGRADGVGQRATTATTSCVS